VSYKKAVALDPKLGLAYYGLGLCYHQQQQWQQAVVAWHHAKALLQPEGAMFITLGNDLYHLKRYDEALESFRAAINIPPPDLDIAVANYWIGVIYNERKEPEKAIARLQEAVRLRPDDPDYNFQLGNAYFFSRKYPEAVAALKESVRVRPNDPTALYALGVAYLLVHNVDDATKVEQELRPLDQHGAEDLHEKIAYQSKEDVTPADGAKPKE
jgi:tetratricopeptide (TPR) repeat protein